LDATNPSNSPPSNASSRMINSRISKLIGICLGTVNARSAALSIAVTAATLHGQVFDETSNHRRGVVGHLTMTFCEAVWIPHLKGYTCGGRHWRATTDGAGRFALSGIKPGWYINAGKSSEVAWYKGMVFLDPSRGLTPIVVCSHKTQPRDCADPRTFATNVQL